MDVDQTCTDTYLGQPAAGLFMEVTVLCRDNI